MLGGLGPLTGLWQATDGKLKLQPQLLLVHVQEQVLPLPSKGGTSASRLAGPVMALEYSLQAEDFWVSVGYGHVRPWAQGEEQQPSNPDGDQQKFGLALRMYGFKAKLGPSLEGQVPALKHEPTKDHVYWFHCQHNKDSNGLPSVERLQKYQGGRGGLAMERVPQCAAPTFCIPVVASAATSPGAVNAVSAPHAQMQLSARAHKILRYDSWFAGKKIKHWHDVGLNASDLVLILAILLIQCVAMLGDAATVAIAGEQGSENIGAPPPMGDLPVLLLAAKFGHLSVIQARCGAFLYFHEAVGCSRHLITPCRLCTA